MDATIGPYRLGPRIGRGGMGIVHEAVHGTTGEHVALKMVKVPSAALMARIRREIQVLATLRHPGIVRILDEGVHEGMPWYAMQLARGMALSTIASELSTSTEMVAGGSEGDTAERTEVRPWSGESGGAVYTEPLPAPGGVRPVAAGGSMARALALARRLCHPLRYLHGEGLVHRDLTPSNVIVRPDDTPVIIDFGLITRFTGEVGREELEVGGSVVGSVSYLAPEQARGELPDARADIYALGCILYELLAGRPPFRGMREEILAQHLHAAPLPPSTLVEGVPPHLDELVLRLLAKEPRDRPGYADDVAAELRDIEGGEDEARTGPEPRPYLYRPALAGRREPMRLLGEKLEEATAGGFALVLVGGEGGAGKTRLVVEAGTEAIRRKLQVVACRCDVASRGPLHGVRGLLRAVADHCREMGSRETERILGRRGAVLAPYEPAIGALPGVGDAPPLSAPEGRARLLMDVAETLRAYRESTAAPLLLAIDDLQWGDELTLALVPQLLRSRPTGVLLLATHGSSEPRPEIDELRRHRDVVAIDLPALEPEEVGEIARDALAMRSVPRGFVERLHRQARGNPLFVGEYLSAAVERGIVLRDRRGGSRLTLGVEDAAGGDFPEMALPDTLRALVAARIDRLDPEARLLLQVAALLGGELPAGLLEHVAARAGLEAPRIVPRLIGARVVEATASGLRIADDRLREVALATLEPERRKLLHRAAALGIEELGAGSVDVERRSALGRHWQEAGEPALARHAYLDAARLHAERYALDEAERLYRAALEIAPEPADAASIRMELAERVLEARGVMRDVQSEMRRALADARAAGVPGLEAEACRMLGASLLRRDGASEAQVHLDRALELHRASGDLRGEAETLVGLAALHSDHDEVAAAEAAYGQALVIARRTGDRKLEGSILGNLGVLHARQGDMREVEPLLRQALAIHVETGQLPRQGVTLGNLGNVWLARGDVAQACAHYEQALAIARRVGDRRYEGLVLGNLAFQHVETGRWEEAQRVYDASLAIHREIGDTKLEAITLGNIGVLLMLQDRLEPARSLLEEAIAIHRRIGDRAYEGAWLSSLAYVHVLAGRIDEGRTTVGTSLAIHEELGNRRMTGIDLGVLALVQSFEGDGDAVATAERGIGILEEIGDRIPLAKGLCNLGHVELGRGRSAAAILARARALAEELGPSTGGPLAEGIARLARAQAAFDEGRELAGGHDPADLAPATLEWLRRRSTRGA